MENDIENDNTWIGEDKTNTSPGVIESLLENLLFLWDEADIDTKMAFIKTLENEGFI